ncbi:hypothetical protein IRJ41_005392 [Triplophysa rosa]|uniref:Fucolectin tachylectin-4 pentraxin-1 domain-containing protein n=1 Tax=Triplophysa rosa TaxID=992332 RepID=A0A9W7X3P8_TRIRA|nr:hypothetical protein IRJ41_005392 [Triplophysa rosa]
MQTSVELMLACSQFHVKIRLPELHVLNVNASRAIILEGRIVVDDAPNLPHAVCLLFALIYDLNLDYTKTIRETFCPEGISVVGRCAVIPDPLPGNTVSYSCHGMEGRYVNVVRSGRTAHLTLCEVEVYETENLAFKGTPTHSSTFNDWDAENAIDGLRYGPDTGSFCSATTSESNPWWRLDLLDYYDISTVIITARPGCCEDQTNGAEIRIGNSLDNNGNNNPRCAVTSGFLLGYTISYSCHGMVGRYVNVVISGSTSALALCEVEVHGKFLGHRNKYFLRLKFSSSGDVAAESDKILHQLQSALASHISDFNLSWTQLPEEEEEQTEESTHTLKLD